MALFDIFKKKKKIEKKEVKQPVKVKAQPKAKKRVRKTTTAPAKPKKISEIAYRVLQKPQVTEKATDLVKKNQYVFRVEKGVNKKDIKKTIEDVYGVEVLHVRVVKVPPKKRKLGRIEGWRKEYKKAIIKVKEGQKIEVLPR